MTTTPVRIPTTAAWLGGLGVLPFAGLAAVLPWVPAELRTSAGHALVAYGATILSFLGGVHWGLGIARYAPGSDPRLAGRLALSVVPALGGWAALLFSPFTGLLILAAGIAAMLYVDIASARSGFAPAWYPRLRVPLSCAVAASLLAADFFVR
jgi:hypothetical protein